MTIRTGAEPAKRAKGGSEEMNKGPSFEIFGGRYGATMSTVEAAELLGCSPERLQQQRGKGTLPVEPLQLGRRLRWPTLLVAEALGLEMDGRLSKVAEQVQSRPLGRSGRHQPVLCRRDRAGAA